MEEDFYLLDIPVLKNRDTFLCAQFSIVFIQNKFNPSCKVSVFVFLALTSAGFHYAVENEDRYQHDCHEQGVPIDDARLEICGVHEGGDKDQTVGNEDAFKDGAPACPAWVEGDHHGAGADHRKPAA